MPRGRKVSKTNKKTVTFEEPTITPLEPVIQPTLSENLQTDSANSIQKTIHIPVSSSSGNSRYKNLQQKILNAVIEAPPPIVELPKETEEIDVTPVVSPSPSPPHPGLGSGFHVIPEKTFEWDNSAFSIQPPEKLPEPEKPNDDTDDEKEPEDAINIEHTDNEEENDDSSDDSLDGFIEMDLTKEQSPYPPSGYKLDGQGGIERENEPIHIKIGEKRKREEDPHQPTAEDILKLGALRIIAFSEESPYLKGVTRRCAKDPYWNVAFEECQRKWKKTYLKKMSPEYMLLLATGMIFLDVSYTNYKIMKNNNGNAPPSEESQEY